MCNGNSQTTNTTQSNTYTPYAQSQIMSALQQGQNAAQLPFNMPQAPVAGFNPYQSQAFGQVQGAQGQAQGYYDQAQQYFSPQGAQQFFNPYASAVMAQMQNVFGQQNSQNTGQLTQAAGGVGADRIAVGQANLANQQGLAAGQTLSQLYGQSQQMAQQAGQNIQGLGTAAQGSALQGANALLGVGNQQQQQQQAELNSPYQYQMAQAQFPYQSALFNAQITGALAPGAGGNTYGTGTTTTQNNPSMLSQISGGLGALGSLGYFFNRGGGIPRNPYASGGPVSRDPIDISGGYIPMTKLAQAAAHIPGQLNMSPANLKQSGASDIGAVAKGIAGLGNSLSGPAWGGGSMFSGDAYGGSGANPLPGLSASDYGAGFAGGGFVNPYADGGDVDDPFGDQNRAIAYDLLRQGNGTRAPDSIPGGEPPPEPFRMAGPEAMNAWRGSADVANDVPAPQPRPAMAMAAEADDEEPAGLPRRAAPTSGMTAPSGPAAPEGKSLAGFLRSPYAALLFGGISALESGRADTGIATGTKYLQGLHEADLKDLTAEQAGQRLTQEAEAEQNKYTRMTPYQQATIDAKKAAQEKSDEEDKGIIAPIVDGIKSGKLPPTTTGLYSYAPGVKAALGKDGFDLQKAALEDAAAKKQISSLNGPQMTRFVGLAKSVDQTIDETNALAAEMKNSGIPVLNRIKLQALINTEGNSPKGQLATRYLAAVNTLKEEFANLANGGYAPTEPAWRLANEQINGNYGHEQLGASLNEVQRLIRYRLNAIPNLQTLGPGAANRYTGQTGAPQGNAAPAAPAKPPVVYQNGHEYRLQSDGSYQ